MDHAPVLSSRPPSMSSGGRGSAPSASPPLRRASRPQLTIRRRCSPFITAAQICHASLPPNWRLLGGSAAEINFHRLLVPAQWPGQSTEGRARIGHAGRTGKQCTDGAARNINRGGSGGGGGGGGGSDGGALAPRAPLLSHGTCRWGARSAAVASSTRSSWRHVRHPRLPPV